ncbi:hypothetical protein LVD15_12555 [Fulvivirga maritima]|uniref:hypothetical protein n=1 Tax=Fulvivirga maritima TaxID=2904247 RepID=UPI001F20256B|nr:hypothetical protein [Fulvivirga maritima]UII29215.1 hypothetical protein LVD15_12555 [Fulvivirga maritima]
MTFTSVILLTFLTLLPADGSTTDTITYQKVVTCTGVEKQVLESSLKEAVYNLYDSNALKIVSDKIQISVDIKIINSLVGKVGSPAGVLDFTIDIEVKDEKFRYTAYDFYFTPMTRNRYAKFELEKEKTEPVIEEKFKGRKTLLKKITRQSEEYLDRLNSELRAEVVKEKDKKIEW